MGLGARHSLDSLHSNIAIKSIESVGNPWSWRYHCQTKLDDPGDLTKPGLPLAGFVRRVNSSKK